MITVIYTQHVCSKCMVYYFFYGNLTQEEKSRNYLNYFSTSTTLL